MTSGADAASLEVVAAFFAVLVDTTVPIGSPAEAELVKLLENTFRHVNIALVNELAMFARELDVDVWRAIDAASTKPSQASNSRSGLCDAAQRQYSDQTIPRRQGNIPLWGNGDVNGLVIHEMLMPRWYLSGMERDGKLTRSFVAGSASFRVRCPSVAIREVVEALFVDMHGGDSEADVVEVAIKDRGDDTFRLELDGSRNFGEQTLNSTLTSLVTAVSRLALDSDPTRLHLHCAALVREGRGVLISAPSGTGKTTLAAALIQGGWSYVSDEAVALELGSDRAIGFAKPLTIKPGGGHLVPTLESARVIATDQDAWWHVPVSAATARIEPWLEPTVVVILEMGTEEDWNNPKGALPLHPADAVVALMSQTMDAERFGSEAVLVLAKLAARCRCIQLRVGPLTALSVEIESAARLVPDDLAVRELVRPAPTEMSEWSVPDTVVSLSIGERVVIHDTAGGAIVALDEAGASAWLALHGAAPSWLPPQAMEAPGTLAFLSELSAHGLVSRSPEEAARV